MLRRDNVEFESLFITNVLKLLCV